MTAERAFRSFRVALGNCVVAGHCADNVPEQLQLTLAILEENVRRHAGGLPLVNVVDKLHGY